MLSITLTYQIRNIYQQADFAISGRRESVTGLDKHLFYLGLDNPSHWDYGLVNVAAFLSQAMTESITNDACSESHWERNSDARAYKQTQAGARPEKFYAISNSCGQHGQNYQE